MTFAFRRGSESKKQNTKLEQKLKYYAMLRRQEQQNSPSDSVSRRLEPTPQK